MGEDVRESAGPGPESVADYPTPPRIERVISRLQVVFAGRVVADTRRGQRVLQTGRAPAYFFPPDDVDQTALVLAAGRPRCEFFGETRYWDLEFGSRRAAKAAWQYRQPPEAYRGITNYIAFHPARVEACWVGDERVASEPGDAHGGWLTSRIAGSFEPETGEAGQIGKE